MKRLFVLALTLTIGGLLVASQIGAVGSGQAAGEPRVVAALGVANIQGERAIVEVLVVVPPGVDPQAAAQAALAEQGARPFESAGLGSEGFTVTGLVWDTLPVVQNYNPGSDSTQSEPTSLNDNGQAALTAAHATWDGVTDSLFDIDFGALTDRCPSLVKECKGPQFFDGNNDVSWLRLDRRTLGVTWYGTGTDEADMALNTRFGWNDGCANVAGSFDLQTVLLHENGHVVGVGHSDDANAIMYPSYQGARCILDQDDEEGATYLYPTQTAAVSGNITDTSGDPISGATVALEGTGLSGQTDAGGSYSIAGVPFPVTYDITASAAGYDSSTVRLQVDQDPETVNFQLGASGGGGEEDNGGPPFCGSNPNHPACRNR